MKWTYQWLAQHGQSGFIIDEVVDFPKEWTKANSHLIDLKPIAVHGHGWFDGNLEELKVSCEVSGTMVVPCARTNEPVDYAFNSQIELLFSFGTPSEDDAIQVKGNTLDCREALWISIQMDIPTRVTKDQVPPKPQGEYWRVISEDEVPKEITTKEDPRWDELKSKKK